MHMAHKLLLFVPFLYICPNAMLETPKEEMCMTCGYEGESLETKIVNGDLVDYSMAKYPWMVSISNHDIDIFCTGALISSNYVLTAAHCLHDYNKIDMGECDNAICYLQPKDVVVGSWHDSDQEPSEQFDVEKVIPHPEYDGHDEDGIMVHDIALLKLTERVQCGNEVGPICLIEKNDVREIDKKLHMAGWGYSTTSGEDNIWERRKLREGILKQIPSKKCSKSHTASNSSDTVICGVSSKHKQIPCEGDSGSSLFKKIDGSYYSLGVGSTILRKAKSKPCALKAIVKFTKVYNHLEWIKEHVGKLPEPEQTQSQSDVLYF